MPITKTYLSNKSVAQVRAIANRMKIATKGKTKAQMSKSILAKMKKSKPGGSYGSQKMANKNVYLVIHKGTGKKPMVSLKTKSEHDKMVKKFKADGFKKVPLHTFIKK